MRDGLSDGAAGLGGCMSLWEGERGGGKWKVGRGVGCIRAYECCVVCVLQEYYVHP
jgi:hypothetical protein